MFRADYRSVGAESTCNYFVGGGTLKTMTSYDDVDLVYSFRSGRGRRLQDIVIPDYSNSTPSERVKQTADFYRDFSASSIHFEREAAEQGESRYSTVDTGHEFVRVKVRTTPLHGTTSWYSGGTTPYSIYTAMSDVKTYPWIGRSPENRFLDNLFRSEYRRDNFIVGDFFRQEDTDLFDYQSWNQTLFERARPGAPTLDIGETLMEFVRENPIKIIGQIISSLETVHKLWLKKKLTKEDIYALSFREQARILNTKYPPKSKVRKYYEKLEATLKESGKDYLIALFVLSPIVSDIIKVVENLLEIHNRVFGGNHRLYGSTRLRTRQRSDTTSDFEAVGPLYRLGEPFSAFGNTFSWPTSERTIIQNYDTRLTGRAGGLAMPGPGSQDFISKANDLMYNLGLQEPDLIWNLTRLSWLCDWWLHLGASITNAVAYNSSGMPVHYAYATTRVRTLVTQKFPGVKGSGTYIGYDIKPGLMKSYVDVLYRRRATPFGFGGTLSSLTSGQMTILAALGLAKAR